MVYDRAGSVWARVGLAGSRRRHFMRRLLSFCIAVGVLVALAATAQAHLVRYHSGHPIPPRVGGGFCYIGFPHVHPFAPVDVRVYRVYDDEYYFIGDPTPFGYEGPEYSYYGPHPVFEVSFGEPVYCYLDGPHFHWYQPTATVTASFEFRGGAFWYIGAYDPIFYRAQPRYMVINEVYRRMVYARPAVDVAVARQAYRSR